MYGKGRKKGFTLVEVIVVLVILAILAAILIPAMNKWIDKARQKQAYIDLHEIAMAAKSSLAEMHAITPLDDISTLSYAGDAAFTAKVDEYIDDADISAGITWLSVSQNTITLLYEKDGYTYSYLQGYDGKVTINSWET